MNKHKAIQLLINSREHLTKQQYKTIKGQIICGDITGAMKGIQRILEK